MTDTPSIETQLAEAQAEATRLREHNATLLSEKKQLAKDYAKLQDDHTAATATLQRLQLDGPWMRWWKASAPMQSCSRRYGPRGISSRWTSRAALVSKPQTASR